MNYVILLSRTDKPFGLDNYSIRILLQERVSQVEAVTEKGIMLKTVKNNRESD
jgi:hypothetical protein